MFLSLQKTMHTSYFNEIESYIRSLNEQEKSHLNSLILDFIRSDGSIDILFGCYLMKFTKNIQIIPEAEQILFKSEKGSLKQTELLLILLDFEDQNLDSYLCQYLDELNYFQLSYNPVLHLMAKYKTQEFRKRIIGAFESAIADNITDIDMQQLMYNFIRSDYKLNIKNIIEEVTKNSKDPHKIKNIFKSAEAGIAVFLLKRDRKMSEDIKNDLFPANCSEKQKQSISIFEWIEKVNRDRLTVSWN